MPKKPTVPQRTLIPLLLAALAGSACDSAPSNNPTPSPTATSTPTASPTTAGPTATASPTATPTATPTSSPPPTPDSNSATGCFNPKLYSDGTRLESTLHWTVPGEDQRVLEYDTIVGAEEQTDGEGPTTKAITELRLYPSAQPGQVQQQTIITYTSQTSGGRVLYDSGSFDSPPLADPPPGTGAEWHEWTSLFFYTNYPVREFRFDLKNGDNYQQDYVVVTSQFFPTFYETNVRLSTTYVSHESISAPAGLFEACKFTEIVREDDGGAPIETETTTWIAVGSGITIRRERIRGDVRELFELVSATLNGEPLGGR